MEKSENYLLEVDEPIVIPVDTSVRFLITSNDVIHSWYMPDFAVKQDAIPGFINVAKTRVNDLEFIEGTVQNYVAKDMHICRCCESCYKR